ncbi:MAG: LysR family transcriptional regulator [Burkholderiaceae bacterium]
MIKKLRSIAIFATVVDQGTFRAAGQALNLAPSRISETVSELEEELGVTLLYRSTRRLSLTNEGQLLYAEARKMLDAAESGLDAIRPTSSEPHGGLRISAPAFLTQTELMDSFARFAKEYPKVSLDFEFSDHPRELIRDGFDVAIRAGWLKDSELLSRNIGMTERLLVASPAYFSSMPKPSHPHDLQAWNWVRFALRPDQVELIGTNGDVVSVVGKSNVVVDSANALYELVLRGLGLSVVPENFAARACEKGDLIHVLPEWSPRPLGLHAVWADQSRRMNLTLMFVRFITAGQQ